MKFVERWTRRFSKKTVETSANTVTPNAPPAAPKIETQPSRSGYSNDALLWRGELNDYLLQKSADTVQQLTACMCTSCAQRMTTELYTNHFRGGYNREGMIADDVRSIQRQEARIAPAMAAVRRDIRRLEAQSALPQSQTVFSRKGK